jgi:sugar phosphate isomerase/epimerase
MLSRREFLLSGATLAEAAPPAAGLRIGVMDGILKLACRPEAIARAKEFGFEGLQVTLGRPDAGNRLPLEEASLQERYLEESRKQNLPLNSTYIDVLHMSCLKSDPAAPAWVERGIEITRRLKAGILMTVFFGKCAIESRRELDYVADLFRDLAPEARRAGVILGFENLLTAEDNARAMDRVASEAFKIYYDVGNAANRVGVDPAREIRFLGKDRICQFHFKDDGYLGEGKVDFPAVMAAIREIGFSGFANLETGSPSGDAEADLRRNFNYLKPLL